MTLDPVSVAVGILATYAFSAALVAVMCIAESRQARKKLDEEVDEAVDQLIARVAVRCIERPTDSRVN